jgi:hypothetical protein
VPVRHRWTTEAGYIVGDRATEFLLRAGMAENPEATFLPWRDHSDFLGQQHDAVVSIAACIIRALWADGSFERQ